jgi:hypothetical protein
MLISFLPQLQQKIMQSRLASNIGEKEQMVSTYVFMAEASFFNII